MMTDGFTVCIYQNADVCKKSNGVAFCGNNFPIMTSLSRAIDFEGQMQDALCKRWCEIFPLPIDGRRRDESNVCLSHFVSSVLPMPIIEICGQITGVLQDSVGGDYIPEAPLQTVVSQEFLGSQPAAGDDEYGGAITEIERLLSIPTAAPNDVIGDKEYENHLMGNDIEDEDYEEEDPNDYEREDPYQYEEVDVGHIGSSSGTEFRPTIHQSSGLVFADKDGVQDALKLFSLKRHVDYRVTRSAEKFIECKYDGPHSCASTVIAKDHPKLDSDMIAGLVTEKADIPIFLVVETVKKARGFTVSYKKAWRGKQKAIARVYGSWVASYNKLPSWMAAMQQAMPGIVVSFQTVDMPGDDSVVQFKRLFWASKPCIDAWWQLKPMLQVDGTFLYGKFSLLIAMGQDGNRNIVPVAFALVEGETEFAWLWFLWRLREHVAKDCEVCLFSDRGTGLLAALDNPGTGWQPPLGHNVFCIRHVASNLNSKFRNRVIRALSMKAGHEYTERGCQRRLDRICLLNKDAANWIDKIPRQKWARAYDEGRRYGHMTTNFAECMNGVLKGVRCLPVTVLVQATLYKVAEFNMSSGFTLIQCISWKPCSWHTTNRFIPSGERSTGPMS
ncbi:uncharacterized protein G2W53_015648 [Senna tora]|uniref:MULE transposase domain-containing protein n=1 Tax=Senna tora TaxID=362788 RepID=A0A834WV71_9FABA|nr:uncharacterized protein G2W53_015648 [Senna tora]